MQPPWSTHFEFIKKISFFFSDVFITSISEISLEMSIDSFSENSAEIFTCKFKLIMSVHFYGDWRTDICILPFMGHII